jgi:hypothetical protein
MSDTIRPLTMTTEEGKPHTRSPAVTEEITVVWRGVCVELSQSVLKSMVD